MTSTYQLVGTVAKPIIPVNRSRVGLRQTEGRFGSQFLSIIPNPSFGGAKIQACSHVAFCVQPLGPNDEIDIRRSGLAAKRHSTPMANVALVSQKKGETGGSLTRVAKRSLHHTNVSHFSATATTNEHAIEVRRTIANSCETESVGYKSVTTMAT